MPRVTVLSVTVWLVIIERDGQRQLPPFDTEAANMLELVATHYKNSSTITASNLPCRSHCDLVFGEATITGDTRRRVDPADELGNN